MAHLKEGVCVVRVEFVYPLRMKGGFSVGEFDKAVQDS